MCVADLWAHMCNCFVFGSSSAWCYIMFLKWRLWTDALSLPNPAAPHLRWIRYFFPLHLSGSCRERRGRVRRVRKGEKGPLASPLQAGRAWHQHCSIITAKSYWWKTLGLLWRAISINIYAEAPGNRTQPSFHCLCRETEEMEEKSDANLGCESSHTKPPLRQRRSSSGMWHENTFQQVQVLLSLLSWKKCTQKIEIFMHVESFSYRGIFFLI